METNMAKVLNSLDSVVKKGQKRFERKFVYEGGILEDIIQSAILNNASFFKEIYNRRTINNLYFDDHSHSFYKMNVSGVGSRSKYRLRWYNDHFESIHSPNLEIKKKYGEVGDKITYELPDFSCNLLQSSAYDLYHSILAEIKDKQLLSKLQLLKPALFNSYERRYFLSSDEKFRITVDYNMRFYNPNFDHFHPSEVVIDDIIIELKYNTVDDKEARKITQKLESRLSKNSKYVRGFDLLYWQIN